MLRESGYSPKNKTVNCIFMNGGVGDHMASLVAVDYIIKNYPWITLLTWVPDFLLDFARYVLPPNAIVNNYSSMAQHYNKNYPTKTTQWDGHTSPMKIHSIDYAFLKLCDENPSINNKNYLQIPDKLFPADSKYVVITTAYTAAVREFLPKHVNEIAKFVKSKGYEVIFLGQTTTITGAAHVIKGTIKEEIDLSIGKNMIDKTTLIEAAKIMAGAKCVIGVDNGLLHVAGCTQTTIIGGFTTVNPNIRMPIRNNILGWNFYPVIPNQDLSCKFCQQDTNFLYGHNYTDCIYKDYVCVSQMTADKFIVNLKAIL